MKINIKSDEAYKTIGEVARALNLIDKKDGRLQTHTLRYWETQFKQIKPSIKAGKRRYYSEKDLEIIRNIKNLLKIDGLTINGVKKLLNKNLDNIDLQSNISINSSSFDKESLKTKIKNIKNKIDELKKYTDG